MSFWIFMLIMNLLIPAIMILFGRVFLNTAPKEINFIFGYRTAMSMKNHDTWEFAHKYIGKLWFRLGLILAPVSAVAMLLLLGSTEETVSTVGLIVCMTQLCCLIATIFPTERALKKNFDQNGDRI